MPGAPAYVLWTRPLSPALVDTAAAKGVIIDSLPFIAVEPVGEGREALPEQPLTAVFTSANAVAALEKGSPNWKIFCLDGATKRQVAEHFDDAAIAATAGS